MAEKNSGQPSQPPARMMAGMRPGGPRHGVPFMGPQGKAKNGLATLKRLWGYLQRQKTGLIAVFLLVLASSACTLAGPFLIGRAIDSMVGGAGAVNFGKLGGIALLLAVIYGCGALATWFQIYLVIGVAQITVRDLRQDLFAKLQTLPVRFFDRQTHGELMSRLTNDVDNINNSLSQSVTQVFSSLITILGSVGLMLWLSPLLTGICLAVVPLGVWLAKRIAESTAKYFSLQQKELGNLNGYIEEIVSGQRVVKAFSHEARAVADFQAINGRLTRVGIRAQICAGIIPPLMNLINNNAVFAIVATGGGWLALRGMITVGVVASFLNYAKQFGRPINELANQFNMLQSALAGAERVFEVMDEEPETEHQSAPTEPVTAGAVAFRDVCFGYRPEVPILKHIDLTAAPGQTVALVGPTGAGKTTIVNLLTRFYEIDRGTITIDGRDIRTLPKDGLRRSLGIVLQESYLFADTVRENIRYGRLDASDAAVERAARLANADHFIERLPCGYDTLLSEDGGNLSQGQRQLLTIARAILADPAILILDEATSSVDTRTEQHIQQAMLELMKGRTSFVIAHRLSTIREADQILVIHGGTIIERGNHRQLLAAGGFYHDLYFSQFRR
jgi:ATP-binding cassette subfamily B multidrug efflux pump